MFHTHAGIVAHDDVIGRPEGSTVDRLHRAQLPGAAAHPGRRGAQDAPGRAGHLPEGPRGHPDGRRHRARASGCSRPAWARAPCRWPCCGPAPRWSATSCARTSPTGPRPTWPACSVRTPTTGWRSATSPRGSTRRDLDRVLLDLPEPWRVLPHAGAGAAPGRDPARLPAHHQPDGPAPRARWTTGRSAWPRRSRSCTGPGTSKPARSVPTTAWWPTPGSSPPPRRLVRSAAVVAGGVSRAR